MDGVLSKVRLRCVQKDTVDNKSQVTEKINKTQCWTIDGSKEETPLLKYLEIRYLDLINQQTSWYSSSELYSRSFPEPRDDMDWSKQMPHMFWLA